MVRLRQMLGYFLRAMSDQPTVEQKSLKIDIPRRLTSDSLAKFSCDLNYIEQVDEYIFDFGEERWFPPFSILFLSMVLREFRQKFVGSGFSARNHEHHGYAAHFGFFQSFGLGFGNHPGEADGSMNYLPIQKLNIAEIREEAWDAAVKLHHAGKSDVRCHLSGTAVRLIIDIRRLDGLPAQLGRFADEGRLAAKQVQGANAIFASSASQMLQRDFKID
jgi:hypothetical protein